MIFGGVEGVKMPAATGIVRAKYTLRILDQRISCSAGDLVTKSIDEQVTGNGNADIHGGG